MSNVMEWLPNKGMLMWKVNIKGIPSIPEDDHVPAWPRKMRKLKDILTVLKDSLIIFNQIATIIVLEDIVGHMARPSHIGLMWKKNYQHLSRIFG